MSFHDPAYDAFDPRNRCYIEVNRPCNAMCAWCDTGMRKRKILPSYPVRHKTMDAVSFAKLLTILLHRNIIHKNTTIFPYNFGEPFLHPNFDLILLALERFALAYSLSTNGSVPLKLPRGIRLDHLTQMVFSMPGFSQASDDRMHGFTFEAVKNTIIRTMRQIRDAGFGGVAEISYHRYRFSEDELPRVLEFAHEHGLRVRSNLATVLCVDIACDFMEGTLDPEIVSRMRGDICVGNHSESAAKRPGNFACNSLRALTVSTDCQLVQCCWVHEEKPGNKLGNIRDMTWEDIARLRAEARNTFCARCRNTKADYFMSGWPETATHAQGRRVADEEEGRVP